MPDGATKLEHLQAAAARVSVPELNYSEPDREAIYLLEHFYSIKPCAGVKITFTELRSYSEMMRLNLKPFEAEVIMRIDRIFEASING